MGLIITTPTPTPAAAWEPPKFSYHYFERWSNEDLTSIRKTIEVLLQDRRQGQFSLFGPLSPIAEERPTDAGDFAAPAAAAPKTDLGDVLSPSQVNGFLMCSARWWFKYGLKLPDLAGSSLALGRAVHKAIGAYYRTKLEKQELLPADYVVELFTSAWQAELEGDVTLMEDEQPDAIAAEGAKLVAMYMKQVAPFVEPAAIEQEVRGQIGGVNVRGFIDLLDVNGRIIDFKTAKQTPSKVSSDYAFQLATYRALEPRANGQVALHTMVRLKTPKLVGLEYTVTAADQLATATLYPLAQDAMKAGLYWPNRACNLCSHKNCPYADACEAEFGGSVD